MEFAGLQVIVSDIIERGTLHAIAPPPMRGDFPTRAKYETAVARWQRTQFWVSVVNIADE